MKKLVLVTAVVMLTAMVGTVRAQEGGTAPALTPEEAKARVEQLNEERKTTMKKMMEARKQALANNPELGDKLKAIREQMMELRKQEEAIVVEASPELRALQDRMKQISTETEALRKAGRPVRQKPEGGKPKKPQGEKPANKRGKKAPAE